MVKNLKRTLALMLSVIMIFSYNVSAFAGDEGIIGSNEAGTSAQVEETVAAEAETQAEAPTAEAPTQEKQVEAATEAVDTVAAEITAQPEDASVYANAEAEFALETNSKVKSCQWQIAKTKDGVWTNLNRRQYGSSETLKIRALEKYNKWFFRCIVTFRDGSTQVSEEARLNIVEKDTLPAQTFGSIKDTKVVAPEGAFPAGTTMEANEVDDTKAVQSIIDDMKGVDGSVLNAVDITFYDGNAEIQPQETVKVTMNVGKDVDFDNLTLVHIKANADELDKDGIKTEKVDFTANKEAGTITFAADHFSTYALAVGSGEATIHWGYMNGTNFVELEEDSTVTMDTTASTISLENSFEGYTYLEAVYCAPGKTLAEGVDINSTLYNKGTDGWDCEVVAVDDTTHETTVTATPVAANSNIYVKYFKPEKPTPSGSGDEKIPSPVTTKTVTDNKDGTYTIQLDIEGEKVQEDQSHYANILVILDATRSMNGTKWTNAKAAMKALIETLCEGDNAKNAGHIDFALVTFGRSATVVQNWTKDNATFKTTCANINMVTTSGTNWEAGMRGGLYGVLGNLPDDDPTYCIFLTDGDPNLWYTGAGSRDEDNGTNYDDTGVMANYDNNQAGTAASRSGDEAKKIAAKTKLYGIYCGDSGTTPSGTSFNRLVNVINGEGQGGQETIAANADTIESKFKAIAETMLKDMGASNVAVDDGVPSLSSISANVVGEAGGYEYYKKEPTETEFSEWKNAPGATYSSDNGVTWDLTKAGGNTGVLPAGTVYRIKFTVWPSQAAYDLIADLNNGKVKYEDLTDEQKKSVTGSKEAGYTLLTNTHLNTRYTFKDTEYSDAPDKVPSAAMPLPTETIKIKKNWPENMLDPKQYGAAQYRDKDGTIKTATEINLTLQRDSKDYLNVLVKGEDGWEKDEIYISCGNMSIKDGKVTIHEPGHDYQVIEPEEFSYLWDLISDVYHPMVINGTAVMLVYDKYATTADNVNSFEINGKIYKKPAGDNTDTLEATNYRRSNLNLTKVAEFNGNKITTGGENDIFTYKVKVKDANSTDGNVWFSAWDPVADDLVKDASWVTGTGVTAEKDSSGANTGYFYVPNDTEVTMKIKANWNVRFLNLYHDSTFSIEETAMPDGYTLKSITPTAQYAFAQSANANWNKIEGAKITGTITEPNNSYTVTYDNTCSAFYVYHSGVAEDGNLEVVKMPTGTYDLTQNVTANTLYGGYYLDYKGNKGTYKDDGKPGTGGIIYNGWNYEWTDPQTVNGKAITPVAGETYYIKEVPTYYLRNYYQINYLKEEPKTLKALYLISAVDDLNYNKTGVILKDTDNKESKVVSSLKFLNYNTNKSVTLRANNVFRSIGITGDGSDKEYLTYFDATGTSYFATGKFTVQPYWETPDGITVKGISTREITISSMTKSGITKVDK